MKKNIIILIILTLGLNSCSKKSNLKLSNDDSIYQTSETKRIIEVFTNRSIEINVNYNKNSIPIIAGNTFNNDIIISLGNNNYSFGEGTQMYEDASINEYISTDKQFSITKDGKTETYDNIYIPNYLEIDKSTINSLSKIKRNGNTIKWNSDKNNLAGIMLTYNLMGYDDSGKEILIENDRIVIKDDGLFSLDPLLTNNDVKSVTIDISRGNAVSYEWSNKKLAFYFVSSSSLQMLDVID